MPQNSAKSDKSQTEQGSAATSHQPAAAPQQTAAAPPASETQQTYTPASQPAAPPAVLTATPADCVGEVRIRAFVYPCSDGDGPFDPSFQPLPQQEITLIAQDGTFSDCATTGDDGVLVLHNVPADRDYKLSVPTLAHHKLNDNLFKSGDVFAFKQSEVKEIELGFVPEPATIRGFAVLDNTQLGMRDSQPVIKQAQLDLFQGTTHIGCVTSGDDGAFSTAVNCPAQLVKVVPRATVVNDSRKLRPLVTELFVKPEPGQTVDLAIPYTPSMAELRVKTHQIKQVNGQTQRVPLSDVTLNLFKGATAKGTPFRQATTRGRVPAIFTDLDAGMYILTASAPSNTTGLEIVQPRGGVLPLFVGEGQSLLIEDQFEFQLAASSVRGAVLDDTTGNGIAGVSVFLIRVDGQGTPLHQLTGTTGEFVFDDLPPGQYICSLAQEKFALPDGTQWELASNAELEQRIQINGSPRVQLPPFRLVPEEHMLIVHLETLDREPLQHGVVDVLDERGNVIATLTADDQGIARYNTGIAGMFQVQPQHTFGGQPLTRIPVTVNSTEHVTVRVPTPGRAPASAAFLGAGGTSTSGSGGGNNHNGELKEAVIDLAAYPVLTEATSPTAVPTTSGGGVGGASLGQIVDNALREVLVWRPKVTDHKGFLAALNQSFTCTETDGRSLCVWTPRSYAVQADLGAITGAQASIYTRAKAILDQSIPLLEGLTPLASAADLQDAEAERAIVESHLVEIVNELGVQGGPIVARVDALFDALLGNAAAGFPDLLPTQIEDLEGQLRSMRDEFGFDRDLVNTIEEEQNLTNFIILFDNIVSLRQSWINQRDFFNRASGEEPFFGTQMVLLSRSLAVISESVHEVYYAMDSVFLDDAERHTVELIFTDPDTRLFVSELLGWTDRFASEEAPRLIQDGGKSGVVSLVPTLAQLSTLVRGAVLTNTIPPTLVNGAQLPAGYRTARVQRALTELAVHLEDALELAEPITRNDDVDVSRLIGSVESPQGLAALADQLASVSDQLRQLRPTDLAQLSRRVQQANGTRRAGRLQRNNRR